MLNSNAFEGGKKSQNIENRTLSIEISGLSLLIRDRFRVVEMEGKREFKYELGEEIGETQRQTS